MGWCFNFIFCTCFDFCYYRKKADTWVVVENEFNRKTAGSVHRIGKILQNKYANSKKRLLKKVGDEKAGIRGTGGRPYRKVYYDGNDKTISEILGDKRLGRQCSQYDDNGK